MSGFKAHPLCARCLVHEPTTSSILQDYCYSMAVLPSLVFVYTCRRMAQAIQSPGLAVHGS